MKFSLLMAGLLATLNLYCQDYQRQPVPVETRWAKEVSPNNALTEYPRPQLQRDNWTNLNGLWDYAITDSIKAPVNYNGKILVPYPLESSLSGVKKTLQPSQRLWYKKVFNYTNAKNQKVLLHFGAVDYQCWVYINGKQVGEHEGGYTAFSFDVTKYIRPGDNELVVKVYDPSDAGIGPRGKQVLNPQNIYYTPSSGIWQTVWLEQVSQEYISSLTITPDIDKKQVSITVHSATNKPVTIEAAGKTVKDKANSEIKIPVANPKLWSPADPHLYDLTITMGRDKVKSYFGMRKISIAKDAKGMDRIFLNNQPYFNLGTLDQGFWPDGLYTASTDEALKFDIEAVKAMGFNTIRKHIKIEPARWYYHADKLGILVWQDFVQPNPRLPTGAKEAFEKQGVAMMQQLHNHPSIVCWVLFNEKWGQYDQQRLTEWVKKTDPSRIVNGHSGEILYVNEKLRSPSPNAYVSSDITDVHSYPDPMNAMQLPGKARVLGEFGGIGTFIPGHQWNTNAAWGYINEKPAALKAKYKIMNQHLQLLEKEGLSASIYTQPFDVEGEQNGLMTYDREVIKIPFEELRQIHAALNPDIGTIPVVTAKTADLTEPGEIYAKMLQQYIEGKSDPNFIKELSMYAAQTGDRAGINRFTALYITSLKEPYTKEDISYIEGVTKKPTDPGFAILLSELKEQPNRSLHVKLMNIVYKEIIEPYVSNAQAKVNWQELEGRIQSYGAPGEEMYLRAKVMHTLNQKDWNIFKPAATSYLEKYGQYVKAEEKKMLEDAIKNN
ncbi:MAG: glycoside hydrolase family 2 TIM barrel-domain containing protein [Niabella sp.]